jgi:iron complex transport system substrate-binding protein
MLQVVIVIILLIGIFQFSSTEEQSEDSENFLIEVTDSNGVVHQFESMPQRVAVANTFAASAMRMIDVDPSIVVGVSGDFYDDELWPEYSDTPIVQQSAHSEIDFEALFDVRPDIYIVFATNGMVDTGAIRDKLEPIGINVIALDFYKYDSLRDEFNVIADLFGKQDEKSLLFTEFDQIESSINDRISNLDSNDRPLIVMEHHASLTRDPVVLTGTSQWTDMIEKAGGINRFADLPGHTTHVDMEAILDANPDVLMFDGITFDIGFNAFDDEGKCQTHMDFISERPGFDSMTAIQDNRMFIMSGEFAGPMMIHGLPTLAKLLHPELFSDFDSESYLDNYFTKYHDVERKGKFVCLSDEGSILIDTENVEEEESSISPLLMIFGLVAVIGIALFLMRGRDRDVSIERETTLDNDE